VGKRHGPDDRDRPGPSVGQRWRHDCFDLPAGARRLTALATRGPRDQRRFARSPSWHRDRAGAGGRVMQLSPMRSSARWAARRQMRSSRSPYWRSVGRRGRASAVPHGVFAGPRAAPASLVERGLVHAQSNRERGPLGSFRVLPKTPSQGNQLMVSCHRATLRLPVRIEVVLPWRAVARHVAVD
jgi:hypothetical protein